ncbi:MAG: trans-aconitate 2-methyltransferase [Actinomycetota bacterium]
MSWDPGQYGRYADERGRPFHDLVTRIGATSPRRVVDLGCGSGALTATLQWRWPDAAVEGIDSSAQMIAAAAPGVAVRKGDITSWRPSSDTDVVISNAALQWVPDHLALLRSWCAELPSGAWLGWQVPGNFGSPSHTLLRALASSPRWTAQLSGVLRHDAVASPETYARLLLDGGFSADVWETTYLHVLTGADSVLEWVRGTGLRPVLEALSPSAAAEFQATYAAELRTAYPASNGCTVFAFRRIFCVGHKP